MDGIYLVDKPVGISSRSVCNQIGKKYHTKKVGHVGTLDPFASGLLIVAVNKATKSLTFFEDSIKEYVATIKLGVKTDSLDNTGKIIKEEKPRKLSVKEIENTLAKFLGKQEQIPPMTSAIHYQGKRLYELAHEGKEVERTPRDIFIYENKLISYDENSDELTIYFKVSKGTYIRTLGVDIAHSLNQIGHLNKLVRVGVDSFSLKEASSLDDILNDKVIPFRVREVLSRYMEVVSFDEAKINDIKNGKIRYLDVNTKHNKILVLDNLNQEIAVYIRNKDKKLEFQRGLF